MANEMKAPGLVGGSTYYAVIRNAAGQYYTGSAFEAYNQSHWSTYAVASGTANSAGDWSGNFPSVAAGVYSVTIRLRSGGSPALTDKVEGRGTMVWDGAAEVTVSTTAAIADAVSELVTGDGAFAITITATTNGTTPITGAKVRLTGGASSFTATANSSGVASFSLDAGTYTLSATASGRAYTPSSLTITGAGNTTITMTANGITPSADPDQTTAYTTTRAGSGSIAPNSTLYFRLKAPAGSVDAWSRVDFTAESDSNGLLQQPLAKSTDYEYRHAKGNWTAFTTGTASTFELPQLLSEFGR